eukprot:5802675-Heterocapsa_arctica.AAC.1
MHATQIVKASCVHWSIKQNEYIVQRKKNDCADPGKCCEFQVLAKDGDAVRTLELHHNVGARCPIVV